jgi:hypothetical protein
MGSKRCFGIIRAALSLLKSVYDFPHNPKIGDSVRGRGVPARSPLGGHGVLILQPEPHAPQ